jgi:hypothetical protein
MSEHGGRTGLSPPTTYPATPWGLIAYKGNLEPRHHVYAADYYSSIDQGLPVFIRGPLLEHPPQEQTMIM